MGKIVLSAAMCGFFAAAVYVSALVSASQSRLTQVSRYNICWSASQALAELTRLEATLASIRVPGLDINSDDVQMRYDILQNRLTLLQDGEFKAFASLDADSSAAVAHLAGALNALRPLIADVRRPGAIATALAILSPLDTELAQLAATANRFGGEQVAEDQHELVKQYWLFTGVVAGLFLCGVGLLVLLGWHNKLLGRAHLRLKLLAQSLRQTSTRLERANEEVQSINAQLEARNRVLQARDREIGTQNKRFDAALNNMSQALCMVDAGERLVVYNQRFAELFALDFTPVPGSPFADFIQASDSADLQLVHARQREALRESGSVAFLQDIADGRTISVSLQPMPEGGWVATYEDVSQRRAAEEQIRYLAHFDGLTGLANRVFFHEQLEPALARADRRGSPLAVLCLDLDGFKDVNDTFGHPIGDALLREVAKRLQRHAAEGDVVARLGGDEFALLRPKAGTAEECARFAARIIDCLSRPYDLDGRHVEITASIGIALAPLHGTTPDELVKNGDLALYRAKADGKRTFRFFEAEMEAERRERRSLENDLRMALDNGELELFFQPLVDARRVEISGFEALLRWHHPLRGLVSPAIFVPIAEEIGIISALGDWVLREACRQATTWPKHLCVSINLSPAQFKSGTLVAIVKDILAETALPPDRLEFEITENVLLVECDATLQALHDFRTLGIRIAMDDFGTGYSSLSYLRRFPFDKIKIDQSFVRELSSRPDCIKIVRSIAALGASLGMTTTAEGVETLEQFEQLQTAGCDQVQGYYFGRPQPAAEIRYSLRATETRAAV